MKCPRCGEDRMDEHDFRGGSGGLLGVVMICHGCGYSKFNSAWEDLNER